MGNKETGNDKEKEQSQMSAQRRDIRPKVSEE